MARLEYRKNILQRAVERLTETVTGVKSGGEYPHRLIPVFWKNATQAQAEEMRKLLDAMRDLHCKCEG